MRGFRFSAVGEKYGCQAMIGGGLSFHKASERCSGRLSRDKLKLYAIFRFSAQS
jgi:hypothetical protein